MTDDKKTALKAVDWIEELLDAYAEQDCGCATLRAHVAQGEHNQKCKLIRAGITDDRPDALPCVSCGKPSDTATPDDADMCWQCFAQFNAAEYDQIRARFTSLLQRDYAGACIEEALDPLRPLPAPNETHPLDVDPFLVFKKNAELIDTLESILDWLGSEVFDDDEKNAHGSTQEERAENISDIIRAVITDIYKTPDPQRPPPAPQDREIPPMFYAVKQGGLTFDAFLSACLARQADFNCGNWTLERWVCSLAGEVGEAANILKKTFRGDMTFDSAREAFADELADVQSYLVLTAFAANIDLPAACIKKFNKVSDRIGSKVKMAVLT